VKLQNLDSSGKRNISLFAPIINVLKDLTLLLSSIVLVHGLNGDATKSWTNDKTGAFWPEDFLPKDIPDARVLTYGYNAAAAFGNTTATIIDHAKGLLSSLVDRRDDDETRPIIFIAHSLGGIVVKQVWFSEAAHLLHPIWHFWVSTAGRKSLTHRGTMSQSVKLLRDTTKESLRAHI
jgi:hypothetical protein